MGKPGPKVIPPQILKARPKSKGGRPPYKPNAHDRGKVEGLAAFGATANELSIMMGMDYSTIERYYADTIARARVSAVISMRQTLYKRAQGTGPGAVTALIFWLRHQDGENWGGVGSGGNSGAPAEITDGEYDLTRLSDDQFEALQRLHSAASGKAITINHSAADSGGGAAPGNQQSQ